MRPAVSVRRSSLAFDNSPEKMGTLLAIPVDLAAIRINSLLHRRASRNAARSIRADISDIDADSESDKSHPDKSLLKYGKSLVRLTDSEEHYTRHRHFDGGLLSKKTQNQHQFLVALRETTVLADEIGLDVGEDATAQALIESARAIDTNDMNRYEAAAVVTALAIQQLTDDSSYQMEAEI